MLWARLIRPELANPTSMRVVAPEDWTTAVTKAPASTPFTGFPVIDPRIWRIRPPATVWSPSRTSCIP